MSGDDVQCGGVQCSAVGGIDHKMTEKEADEEEKEEKEEEEKEDEEEIEEDI
jgi:ribosomal protein L12E/L44/L45/RPP1/RPP2